MPAPVHCHADCETVQIDAAWDACGLAKPAPKPGLARATGGVTSCTLSCGVVCNIAIRAGHESATQIYGLLGEVLAHRSLEYVVYDNACMLHRFVQNVSRKLRSTVGYQMANQCYFVLDRFHRQNHVSCLSPSHRLYLPSVDIDRHAALRNLNTSQNEQWNAWLDKFAHVVRSMRFEALDLYLLLISELWNSHVIVHRHSSAPPPVHSPRRPGLKVRRQT